MSEDAAAATEATETAAEVDNQRSNPNELPADHPLVKTLAVQKAEIKELKSRAARLTEIEEAQKTDAEKFADRISKAEAEVLSVPSKVSEALKSHLVALHEISDEDAELFLTAVEPETLLKQVARLVGQSKQKRTNTVPREGSTPESAGSDEAAFARELFSS
ncbi:MAG: hypothetical protein ACR2JI_05110 [Mycobacterium sp.]